MRTVKIAAAIIACAIQAYGAATVTASRDYVDRKTTLHPSSNGVEQVGYFLGTQTNKVLASKEYVDNSISASSPGDYLNVSNKAYGAYNEIVNRLSSVAAYPKWESGKQSAGGYVVGEIVSHSGLLYMCTANTSGTSTPDVYSNAWTITTIGKMIDGNIPGDYNTVSNAAVKSRAKTDMVVYDTNGVSTVDRIATTGDVEVAVSRVRTDRITDGTNTIDAAGNVYSVGYTNTVWIWRGSTDYGQPIWKYVDDSDFYFWWLESVSLEPTSEFPHGQNATNLVFEIDEGFVSCYRDTFTVTNYVGKLSLTNDIPSAPDYTTNNTQLVATIEATAPAPGNYSAVSNAAMNARSKTDLNVYLEFTEDTWIFYPIPPGYSLIMYGFNTEFDYWEIFIKGGDGDYQDGEMYSIYGDGNEKTLGLNFDGYSVTATNIPAHTPFHEEDTLAKVSQIDYTTNNTQLVATIEATAPAPGNYSAVSNAAMNARSMTELGVRGEPQGEGSWFMVDGVRVDYTGYGEWDGGNFAIATMVGGYQIAIAGGSYEFVLDDQYSAVVNGRVIVGYTNTLAQVSQIPDVPSASDATPLMDGTASAGTTNAFARGDHVHPSDTAKLDCAAAYPAWYEAIIYSYIGTVVSHKGRLWKNTEPVTSKEPGVSGVTEWTQVYIKDLKQDALPYPTNAIPYSVMSGGPVISPSDPTFSNAVLSVGLNIDTNTVAAINELVDQGEELPIGGATTVGTLLLALVVAIAALKRKKADKVSGATAGNLAALTAQGNLADSGAKVSDFAAPSDLPYRLVEPGKWEFSGEAEGQTVESISWDGLNELWVCVVSDGGSPVTVYVGDAGEAAVSLMIREIGIDITATRASLPGHLLDRAVNSVPVSSATGITLPNKIAGGKSRDFYVRLTVSAEGDGSTVTFASTDSGGDAVTWDSMGDPSGTFAEGTYLYRITESNEGLMHADDMMALEGVEDALNQINDGTSTPSALDMKLDATSAAPAFDPTLTYLVDEHVTYGGILYRCKIAVTVAGPWTGDSNWVDVDMTSPDATLDIRSDGRLAVVAADSEILWIQGYDMASASDVVLSCDRVNLLKFSATTAEAFDSTSAYAVGDRVVYGGMVYKFTAAHSAGDWVGTDAAVDSMSLTMPTAPSGKVGDFVLDVDNSANASVKMVADLSGLFTSFDVIIPKGQNLFTDILTFEGGEMCELYFTMTAFGTAAKPAWKVVKQVVEKQEAGS